MTPDFRLQQRIALLSLLLLGAKFGAYYLTSSVAILTDAMESIVNVAAAGIGLYSLWLSGQPRDRNHPYGHGKAEFISAAVEGTLLLTAGLLILYKAAFGLIRPPRLGPLDLGMVLIGATALVNGVAGRTAMRQGDRSGSLALSASGRHLLSDALSTFGIVAALALVHWTGLQWIDPLVGAAFACYILFTGYTILRRSLAGIMDEADLVLLGRMVEALQAARRNNWVDLHNLRVIKYGGVLHLDCHLTLPWYLTVADGHEEVEALSRQMQSDFGERVELFVHTDGCAYFQCPICCKEDCPVRQHPFTARVPWTLDNLLQNERHGPGDTGESL